MSRKGPSAHGPLPVLLGLGFLLWSAGAFLFGVREAVTLARSSLVRVVVDGALAGQGGSLLDQVVLSTQGGIGPEAVPCRVVRRGVAYPGRIHADDEGRWRLVLDSISPWSGIRSVCMARADEASRIAWKAELDMAGIMGLATARMEVVSCLMNDVPQGLRNWGEVVGPDTERRRGLHDREVPVFHCASGDPWAPDAEWVSVGTVPEASGAEARVRSLLGLLSDTGLPDSLWTDSLSRLVDVEALLRLHIWEGLVLDGRHPVPHLVAGYPSGRLYPLVGAFPRFLPDSLRSVVPTDRLLQVAGERVRYDSLRKECLDLLLARGAWRSRVSVLAEGLAPHVARDHGARFVLPGIGDVPVRTSVLDWESAVQELLQRTPRQEHGS